MISARLLGFLFISCAMGVALPTPNQPAEAPEIAIIRSPHEPFFYAHQSQVNRFIGAPGNGVSRMRETVPGVHSLVNPVDVSTWRNDTISKSVIHIGLVGLLAAPAPRVYFTDSHAIHSSKNSAEVPAAGFGGESSPKLGDLGLPPLPFFAERVSLLHRHFRGLDDFEQTGLDQLVKGEELVAISTDHWFRGMGAIRANASCLECHTQAQEGDLLGAFSYFGVVKVLNVMDAMESRGLRSSLSKLIQERASPERYWVSLGERPKVTDHEKRWFGSPEAQLHRSIAIQGLISPEMLQTLQRDRQAAVKIPSIFKNEPTNPLGYKGGYPRVE